MVIKEAINKGKDYLLGVETAVLDTQLFICRSMNIEKIKLITGMDREMTADQEKSFFEMLERRKNGEPAQYILGSCEFMGLDFKVTPAVLIPRPDTETLVELVLDRFKGGTVLDIGTGSGCVAISIAHYCKNASVSSMDISAAAIEVAKENARVNNVEINFINKDVFSGIDGMYDVIVSNPPYIETDVIKTLQQEVQKEPVSALDGGADGLDFYRQIIKIAPEHLTPGGFIAFEIGYTQAQAVKDLLEQNGNFEKVETHKDLAGLDRVVCGYRR